MVTILLSYRREDSAWVAGRMHDRLKSHYGADNVFMDIDSIPFGLDFRDHIQRSLDRCDILIAIVGPQWAAKNEQGQLRICEEADWVRIEIETALAKKIPVIPVLIDGAKLPPSGELPEGVRNIVYRQAAEMKSGGDFHPHMDRLIAVMDQLLGRPKREQVVDPIEDKKQEKLRDARRQEERRTRETTEERVDEQTDAPATLTLRRNVWRLLTSPKGRLDRRMFWLAMIGSYLLMFVVVMAILFLMQIVGLGEGPGQIWAATGLIAWAWVAIALGSKRLHDLDWSAFWLLIPAAIGIFGGLFVMALGRFGDHLSISLFFAGLAMLLSPLGFMRGTEAPNRFGPNPPDKSGAA